VFTFVINGMPLGPVLWCIYCFGSWTWTMCFVVGCCCVLPSSQKSRFCYEFRQMFIQIHSKNDTLLRTEGVYCIMYEHANGSGLPVVGVRLLVDIVFHMAHSVSISAGDLRSSYLSTLVLSLPLHHVSQFVSLVPLPWKNIHTPMSMKGLICLGGSVHHITLRPSYPIFLVSDCPALLVNGDSYRGGNHWPTAWYCLEL